MRKFILIIAALAALITGLSACGEQPAKVTETAASVPKDDVVKDDPAPENDVIPEEADETDQAEADQAEADVVEDDPAPENDVIPEEAEETDEAEADAAKVGDTVEVGDWSVKVTEVALNANEVLANEDFMNEKPKGQFVLATYEATYNGDQRTADAFMDLSWSLTTNDQKISGSGDAMTPADYDSWPTQARKGGTVKHQVMFDVNPATLPESILSVEGYDDVGDTIYADFWI